MAGLTQVIQSVLTNKYKLCSLCLKVIQEDLVSMQDEVILKEEDKESAIKVFDVLTYVLGFDACNNYSAFKVICKHCTRAAVSCYKFISTCKENMESLSKVLCRLDDCFKTVAEETFDRKTLFVTLDSTNLTTQQFYHNKHNASTSDAFKSFQSIFDSKSQLKKTHRLEKKKKNKLKTIDMLYDPNDPINFTCKVCFKPYLSLGNLRNHFIRVHAPKNFKCSICLRKFGSKSLLDTHKNSSHCFIICSECGKTFNNRHTYKMHEIGHYRKLICPNCGRIYKSQTTFKKHIDLDICSQKTRASPANAKYTCDYCNKKYTQKVSLRVHIQYEHGNYKNKSLVCKWCNKKFWAKSRLDAHIVKHTQEKKFQCTHCGGKYVSKMSLLYHTRIHTGERPYKCEFCDDMFLSTSRKADHIKRKHSNVTFQCNICRLRYTSQLCLDKHKETHENPSKDKMDLHILDRLHVIGENGKFLEMTDDEEYVTPNIYM